MADKGLLDNCKYFEKYYQVTRLNYILKCFLSNLMATETRRKAKYLHLTWIAGDGFESVWFISQLEFA